MIRRLAPGLLLGLLIASCTDVPEVAYETEHFEVAPDFDHPICAGTLAYFETHLKFVESALARSVPLGQRIRFYWITEDLDSWCSKRAQGCYYPGTRVIAGGGESVSHEIVHAVLNAEAQTNYFLEEGIAELYSGVGGYRRDQFDTRPDPGELLWLSPSDYRFGALDYAVAGHFLAYIEDKYGSATTRALASVVVTAAGPPELEQAFSRFTGDSFATIEADYKTHGRSYYRGLHELDVPAIEDTRWVDVSLRCDDELTFGPLPDNSPGMYRSVRLVLRESSVVEAALVAPPEFVATFVDVRGELSAGVVVDFFHPKLGGTREHPVLHGGETASLELRAGTHLIVISEPGYRYADAFLRLVPHVVPREPEPE